MMARGTWLSCSFVTNRTEWLRNTQERKGKCIVLKSRYKGDLQLQCNTILIHVIPFKSSNASLILFSASICTFQLSACGSDHSFTFTCDCFYTAELLCHGTHSL